MTSSNLQLYYNPAKGYQYQTVSVPQYQQRMDNIRADTLRVDNQLRQQRLNMYNHHQNGPHHDQAPLSPLTEEERALLQKQVRRCCVVSNALCFSKCEIIGASVGGIMTITGAVLSAVNDTASMAVAFPGIGLLLGMFAKRIFINVYSCATKCSDVPDEEEPCENTWKDWCLLGRATPFCCKPERPEEV